MKLEEVELKRLKSIDITQISIDKLLKEYPSVYHFVTYASVWSRAIHKILSRMKGEDETNQETSIYIKPTKVALELLLKKFPEKGDK
jgi:hypothetical protein